MKYNILGEEWTINLFSNELYNETHSDASRAMTTTDKKTIDFNVDYLNESLVLHELTHAYVSYQINLFVANKERGEENLAEFMELFGLRLFDDTKKIYFLLTNNTKNSN